MKNPITTLVNIVRGTNGTEAEPEGIPGLGAWHTYEQPGTGDRFVCYNGSPRSMPLEMNIKGKVYAHVAPFGGRPEPDAVLKKGDYLFRPLTLTERTLLVDIKLKAWKKAKKGSPFKFVSDHERKIQLHRELVKECAVFQIQAAE